MVVIDRLYRFDLGKVFDGSTISKLFHSMPRLSSRVKIDAPCSLSNCGSIDTT
jgi:hypothetical protein